MNMLLNACATYVHSIPGFKNVNVKLCCFKALTMFVCQASSVKFTEKLASKKRSLYGYRPWPRAKENPPPTKIERLVIVRGTVHTRASLELSDSSQDDAIVPQQTDVKAVYLERTQTVDPQTPYDWLIFSI